MSVNDLSLDHAGHDELLIAALAAGDLAGPGADAARRLVASCPTCDRLHDDIRALTAATAALPAPRRRRDFRLTEADAAGLRTSGWRGILSAFAGPRFTFVQPLGGVLAALGLAGLLVATVPSVLPPSGAVVSTVGSAASVPEADRPSAGLPVAPAAPGASLGGVTAAGPAPVPTALPAAGQAPALAAPSASGRAPALAAPSASGRAPALAAPSTGASAASDLKAPGGTAEGGPGAPAALEPSTAPSGADSAQGARPDHATGPEPAGLLAAGSLVLLVAGAGLFLLARSARRSVRPSAGRPASR